MLLQAELVAAAASCRYSLDSFLSMNFFSSGGWILGILWIQV